MSWDAISAAAEVFGLIAIVVSLVYIAIQTKQTNEHASASSEAGWITAWNEVINDWVSDERTTETMQRGFNSFDDLTKKEKALFMMRVAALVNQWILARQLSERGLFSASIADEVRKVVVAVLSTPGGLQYFEVGWKLYPYGEELLELARSAQGAEPSWIDILPWWSADKTNGN